MKIKILAATAILVAIVAPCGATPIPITALPFNISTPGTYILTSNLTCSVPQPAITINSPVAGKIILDLGGFTIQAVGNLISGVSIENPTNSVIIVRNGTLEGFFVGIDGNPAAQATDWISNVHIENIVFYGEF